MASRTQSVNVGIVDDSAFMRSILTKILEERGHTVVGEASDGESAIELVTETDVDVLTMDISMPGQGGRWAIDEIMDNHPVPIVVISAHVHEEEAEALELMERGVVDIIRKPGGKETTVSMWERADEIADRIAGASQSEPGQAASIDRDADESRPTSDAPGTQPAGERESTAPATVVIGSSTGGPDTVQTLLKNLSPALNVRVIVVQHMTDALTESFARRLDSATPLQFREAASNQTITAGDGVLAKGGYHLEVVGYRNGRITVDLSTAPKLNNVRPAVDATMRSAAACIDDLLIGVVLTGMGKDGAIGIQSIAEAGGRTIAQDEATSRIFGMPKAAIETGAVEEVLPVEEIPAAIERLIHSQASE
ncbi:chemotaxis-specific protein-glutamate methyltransferase CheB [Halobacteria archaeon AArc-dxtr1]|nr:chemotaxis-specific protein-glutamate methyltransferase CheB [Halobacteria archaeon AArc-dxtr1]